MEDLLSIAVLNRYRERVTYYLFQSGLLTEPLCDIYMSGLHDFGFDLEVDTQPDGNYHFCTTQHHLVINLVRKLGVLLAEDDACMRACRYFHNLGYTKFYVYSMEVRMKPATENILEEQEVATSSGLDFQRMMEESFGYKDPDIPNNF
jgi:hypothetical protein